MTNPDIDVRGMTKAFGNSRVLCGVDIEVPQGTVFSLLGPNGAGKTTAVRVMATLTEPDAGSVRIAGHDVVTQRRGVRSRISLTGQDASLDELQTGEENLRMIGRLRGLRSDAARIRAGELLKDFDLADAAHRAVSTYSGGMRRRLDFAMSLVTRPEVVFLDEPTTGLDPRSRQAVWNVVASLTESGATVLLTTQYLDEADRLSDRIALLDRGRIVAEGTAAELKRTVGGQRLEIVAVDDICFDHITSTLGTRAAPTDPIRRTIWVATSGTAQHVLSLLDEIDPGRRLVQRFALHETTLDDVFMALTGLPHEEPAHV